MTLAVVVVVSYILVAPKKNFCMCRMRLLPLFLLVAVAAVAAASDPADPAAVDPAAAAEAAELPLSDDPNAAAAAPPAERVTEDGGEVVVHQDKGDKISESIWQLIVDSYSFQPSLTSPCRVNRYKCFLASVWYGCFQLSNTWGKSTGTLQKL